MIFVQSNSKTIQEMLPWISLDRGSLVRGPREGWRLVGDSTRDPMSQGLRSCVCGGGFRSSTHEDTAIEGALQVGAKLRKISSVVVAPRPGGRGSGDLILAQRWWGFSSTTSAPCEIPSLRQYGHSSQQKNPRSVVWPVCRQQRVRGENYSFVYSSSSSSSRTASCLSWYSVMRSRTFLSASWNSISSIPSPLYQWRNAFLLYIAPNW